MQCCNTLCTNHCALSHKSAEDIELQAALLQSLIAEVLERYFIHYVPQQPVAPELGRAATLMWRRWHFPVIFESFACAVGGAPLNPRYWPRKESGGYVPFWLAGQK